MTVKVKICGLTNLVDTFAALEAGADMLGFIFFAKSPRCVTPEQVSAILAGLGKRRAGVLTVGVFVNEPLQTVAQILNTCGLDAAQLHGNEPPEMLAEPILSGRVYKALRPRSPGDAAALAAAYALPASLRLGGSLPAFLIDAYHPQLRGGTGRTSDWGMAATLSAEFPLLLAGGLTPQNVSQAVNSVRPWGVDVASGVESAPGQKDPAALRAFITAAKNKMGVS